jgi:ribosomal protein S1
MSELSFEEMLDETFKTIHTGEVVDGTVIDVKEDQIILNIGYKADGIITRSEYTSTPGVDLTTLVNVGDQMQAKVLKVNDGEGQVLLTYRRLVADNGNKKLEEAFENQTVLTAKVNQVMNGGLGVVIDEARVFIPASLVSDSFVKDLSVYKDKEVSFVITEYNPKRRRIIGDCKKLIVEKKEAAQKELLARIKEGDTIEGTVKNVTDFGAFIDLGGVDGLLHISEMSWGRTENPKKLYKVGDSVKCFIKEINGDKIALSVKYPDLNPWNDAAVKYAVGNVVKGTVARMTDFGAFVQLEEGIDALLHVSQISKEHINKPSDVLSIGQEIEAKVVDMNEADKKISLSVKAMFVDEEESAQAASEADETVASTDVTEE